MLLELKFSGDKNEVTVWHGDTKLGVYKAQELVASLGQAHGQSFFHKQEASVFADEFLVTK